ncbi:MAG: DNA polymerase-3 subunit psi [Psychromonas sp.]|jgi:DNA polymerase-3 subunit psi|uniref:DNA polymerase III subunit psi n=1 Tax=Psychromonas sp. TaxID=1884585 RepID=UPI0039E59D76
MKDQQALYLQEMGITRWQVRKPELFPFSFNCAIDLSHYKLLLVASTADFAHPLLLSIVNAFNLKLSEVYCCSMAQFKNLQGQLPELIWSTQGEINQPQGHKLLTSVTIDQLVNDAKAKKSLWKQFCAFNQ